MRKAFLISCATISLLVSGAYAYDAHDFQVWNTDVEEFSPSDKLKISLEEEFRWADNANEFSYQHYDLGFAYRLNKFFSAGAGYRQVYELKKGKFEPENEPYLAAFLFWNLRDFKFDDRNRLEYRHFNYQGDSWRYRNKLTLMLPWKFTPFKGPSVFEVQPYLSDEIFIAFAGINELNQNRLASGLAIKLTKAVKFDLYYMLQSVKFSEGWKETNVLGAKIKVVF